MSLLLAAPDSFRSTARAVEVAAALGRAARRAGWDVEQCPLSDGGEGFLDVLAAAMGASMRTAKVTGPLGEPVEARWAVGERAGVRTGIVEMAQASGLELIGGPEANDPMEASTHGTGELIAAAARAGAKSVLVGCGGSATTDGGEGALDALRPHSRLAGVELVVACDVQTRFLDAATRFAPQKGATPAQVRLLARRLEATAERYRREFGVDVTGLPGAGAAGGLAGGLAALGAELVRGLDVVADAVALVDRIEEADLVVTGEGFLDAESFDGKVVGSVAALALEQGKPTLAVVGQSFVDGADLPPLLTILSLTDVYGQERSMAETARLIEEAVLGYLAAAGLPDY